MKPQEMDQAAKRQLLGLTNSQPLSRKDAIDATWNIDAANGNLRAMVDDMKVLIA